MKLYSPEQAIEERLAPLYSSASTLKSMATSGHVPYWRGPKGRVAFSDSDIDRIIELAAQPERTRPQVVNPPATPVVRLPKVQKRRAP
ncbi:MAG: hypothetical protein ACRDN9_07940 [Streptosporangiaceae bacterium]